MVNELTPCEWSDCTTLTHKRFCRQACREKWQYYNNPEWRAKKLAKNTQYNRDNPEKSKQYQKNWYTAGGKAKRDAWRANNRERYNELLREWANNNKETVALSNKISRHKRRAMLAERGTFTAEEWIDLCARFDFKCANCGKNEQTIDHVVPLFYGGMNTIDNLQPLCKSCNSSKGTKIIDYRDSLSNS